MVMTSSPLLTAYVIPLSLYSSFKHFCTRKDRAGLYTLSFVLSFLFAARSFDSSYLFGILLGNDNYGGYAVSCLLACLVVLDGCFDSFACKKKKVLHTIGFSILFALLSGIKAPVALVFLGGTLATLVLGIILKKVSIRDAIFISTLTVVAFVIIYKVFLGSQGTTGVGTTSIFSFGKMTGICFWKTPLIQLLKGLGVPSQLRLISILLVFTASFLTIYTLPFVIGYLRELYVTFTNKREYSVARVSADACAVVGFVLMMFLRYSGHSQVYFGTVTAVFAPLIAFWYFEDISLNTSRAARVSFLMSKAWFFVLIVFTSLSLFISMYNDIPSAVKRSDPSAKYNKYLSLSADEYKACKWIKDNTPVDSIIATQMYSSVGMDEYDYAMRWHNCHFIYSA